MEYRELIEYNESLDRLTLNLTLVKMIPEFRKLYEYRKTNPAIIKGIELEDAEFFEFKMIWWVYNPASPGFQSGLPLEDVLEDSRFRFAPHGWRKTTIFNEALEAYEVLMDKSNPIYSLLKGNLTAISSANRVVKKVTSALDSFISTMVVNISDQQSLLEIQNARGLLNGFLADGKLLSNHVNTVRSIIEKYNHEEAVQKELRGGKPYLISMDPNNDIERLHGA